MDFELCDDEGLRMETQNLRYALTQPYASTFRAFTMTDCGRRVRRCSLGFPCVLNDMCISVNCIVANQLIFYTEQCVFIYDHYLLT